MKRILPTALLVLYVNFGATSHAQLTNVVLGTDGLTVEDDFTLVNYSQTASTLTVNDTINFGSGILAGFFGQSYDWSAATEFGLTMAIIGSNPNMFFSLELVNPDFATVGLYTGFTSSWGSTFESLTLEEEFRGDLSEIIGINLTFNGTGQALNAEIATIDVIPEPSTWALLGLGALVTGAAILRRRRKAA